MARHVMKIVANVFTGILIAVLCLIIVAKVIALAKNDLYSSYFGYTALAISSGSMEPTLNVDDIILVKVNSKYSVNDIVSYVKDGAIITHRVISVSGNNIIVKGDANNSSDKPISDKDIIGKVVKVYPHLKRWKDILSDPKTLIGLVITLVLFDFAISYKKGDKKQKLAFVSANNAQVSDSPQVVHVNKEESQKKDIVLKDDLMELTRAIDINEIDELLSEPDDYTVHEARIPKLKKDDKVADVQEIKVSKPVKKVKEEVKEEDNKEEEIAVKKVTARRGKVVVDETPKKTSKATTRKAKEFKLYEEEEEAKEDTIRLNLKAIQKTIEKKVK